MADNGKRPSFVYFICVVHIVYAVYERAS
jgi:hypothetical protein